jgi:signal transduction histidine kinase
VKLLRAVLAQRREREVRLMTGDSVAAAVAHEVKQPLTAMIASADASFRFLDRRHPISIEPRRLSSGSSRTVSAPQRWWKAFARTSGRTNGQELRSTSTSSSSSRLRWNVATLQKRRIVVRAEPNTQLPLVRGNRVQLQQVLLNLITNAIDAMAIKDEPRVLCVKSDVHEADGVLVSVADTGTGINSQDIDKIFNPLFTTKSDGMGMGLSICRSIVEAHQGRLWVTPNAPRGSVFQFTFARKQFGFRSGLMAARY